jgi:hypothetical protein
MKPNTVTRTIQEQVETNRIGLDYQDTYAGHRDRLTAEIVARASAGAPTFAGESPAARGRLCLLGAGNAFDVDLETLADHFDELHLVDIDAEALARVSERASGAVRAKLRLHAAVDVSGSWEWLAEWARRPNPAVSILPELGPAVARVVAALPGPFDVVVSCCMLTQLQLVVLEKLGDRHPAFEPLRALTNAVHVRVMAGLLAASGRGLLVTDLTSDATYPLDAIDADADLSKLMAELVSVGNVMHSAHPGLLSAEIRRDPVLSKQFEVRFPVGPWLWHNGPHRIFLVYGLELRRRAPAAGRSPLISSVSGGTHVNIVEMDNIIPKLYEDMIEAEANALGWYFHPESARPGLEFKENYGGFFHMAYDGQAPNPVGSAINAILVPLLFIFCDKAKLDFNALVRVRLGMFTRSPVDVRFHNPHVDFYAPHRVALYYVNDSDGDTVVFNETSDDITLEQSVRHANENKFTEAKRIAPKKGRMVAFDGKHYHSSMHPLNNQSRIVVTFNFT